jgi:hypothetical protein
MSNTSTFALGLGSGAALWYLTKNKHKSAPTPTPASSGSATPTATTAPNATATAQRNAEVQIDQVGIAVDGARVELAEAVRRCAAIGHASVTVAPNAPASTCAALMSALAAGSVPTVRNLGRRNAKSQRPSDTSSTFTLVVFPEGIWGTTKRVRYFQAEPPTTWEDARDRLAATKFLDRDALSPNGAGAWRLITDPARFRTDRAETLPGGAQQPRGARATERYTREGRTILRDGERIVHVDRVDLGDERYAISPHHADLLTDRMVRLLNRHGAR